MFSIRAYFASIVTLGIPYLFWLGNLDVFESPLSGVRTVSIGVGILIIAAGIMPARICVGIMFFAKLGLFFTYFPGRPLLTLTTKPFYAFASSGFWVLVISMRADVADWDEYTFGRRREGMIAAINNWMVKVAFTVAIASSGIILQYVAGFDIKLQDGQSMETLQRIKLAYVAIPSVAIAIVFLLLTRYSLTKAKLHDVRTELETRRNAV